MKKCFLAQSATLTRLMSTGTSKSEEFHRRGFLLTFLGHDGRWKNLTP